MQVKPLKELAFNSPDLTAGMTSRQFQVMMDVLTNLLFARTPRYIICLVATTSGHVTFWTGLEKLSTYFSRLSALPTYLSMRNLSPVSRIINLLLNMETKICERQYKKYILQYG